VAYVTTSAIPLRCTNYSETSQVVALATPDMGQIHALAKGSRKPARNSRKSPWEVLTNYDCVLSQRSKGKLHIVTEWAIKDSFSALRRNLPALWAAFYAAEVLLWCTSENAEDGGAHACLLELLRRLEAEEPSDRALFSFLSRVLRVIGCAPVAEHCVQCRGDLRGLTRFSPAAGGGVCGNCALADPTAFSVSRGTLAVMQNLAAEEDRVSALRITSSQAREIQRAFNEQIQYHLGKPLRSIRFAQYFMA
jgi:DNA repair protein RecO (recombination protein O)